MNEEKDRFGEFISLLERAREDVYFAAKDVELLEKLKRRLQTAQREQWEDRPLNCPQCGIALQQSSVLDQAVKLCSGCGGMWVQQAALQELLKRLEMRQRTASAPRPWRNATLRYVWPPAEREKS